MAAANVCWLSISLVPLVYSVRLYVRADGLFCLVALEFFDNAHYALRSIPEDVVLPSHQLLGGAVGLPEEYPE